jgi:hypothetical protein
MMRAREVPLYNDDVHEAAEFKDAIMDENSTTIVQREKKQHHYVAAVEKVQRQAACTTLFHAVMGTSEKQCRASHVNQGPGDLVPASSACLGI